jgi:ribosomal protein S18 acetylase RimI-like enzyme
MFRIARRMHPGLTLTVYKDNARAVAFYEKHGLSLLEERFETATNCVEYIMGFQQDT